MACPPKTVFPMHWLIFFLMALGHTLSAQIPLSSEFYRISSPSAEATIQSLSPDFRLSWINSDSGSNYVVEKSQNPGIAPWWPFIRGVSTNEMMEVKVGHDQPPDGMVFIPGGRFMMGDVLGDLNNATPVHEVYVSPFFMNRFEVTIKELHSVLQWAHERSRVQLAEGGKFITDSKGTNLMEIGKHNSEIRYGTNGFTIVTGHENYPAPYITWYGAVTYCNWLSEMLGMELGYDLLTWKCDFSKVAYRLPTEAEWEYAARGGHYGMRFPWGHTNVISHELANYKSSTNFVYDVGPPVGLHPLYANNSPPSSPVGSFAPNNFGLYDMCGNVWEWVNDLSNRYSPGFQIDPTGPEGTTRFTVFRGGSWLTRAASTTVASRYRSVTREDSVEDVGFRVVLPYRPRPAGP
jgi:formylglycine-generating enzyme required for sulfatase activity